MTVDGLPELVTCAQCGDIGAFEEIVLRYQDMSVAYAYSLLGDFHLAEDASQEAFLEAFRSLGSLREPRAFPAWLKRIILKYCDRATRRKRIAAGTLSGRCPADSEQLPPERAVEEDEMRRTVTKALSDLTEKERTAVALFYINGYSQKDIAAFLGISAPVVKSRLHRARRRLKARLMAMVEDVLKDNAPDESFAERVARAAEVYASRGPDRDLMDSQWKTKRENETAKILQSGEGGFQVDLALSRSPDARLRTEAALHFGLRADDRSRKALIALMQDRAWEVRRASLVWYASAIHPAGNPGFFGISQRATEVPEGVEDLLGLLGDSHEKVRLEALRALRAYVGSGDERVESSLRRALDDAKHKVRHMAACHLGIACPGCGEKPRDHWG